MTEIREVNFKITIIFDIIPARVEFWSSKFKGAKEKFGFYDKRFILNLSEAFEAMHDIKEELKKSKENQNLEKMIKLQEIPELFMTRCNAKYPLEIDKTQINETSKKEYFELKRKVYQQQELEEEEYVKYSNVFNQVQNCHFTNKLKYLKFSSKQK